ncbi:hypothetical protein KCP76_10870 [Salmonella enterica subsp. enterica serovar Weltevreden]|nr:hypothetical protein KCP76_10870 [Salmonella enterica subsp. enterica serovar Weltevreden]
MQLLDEELRHEVTPKIFLMIGPTGVGKTGNRPSSGKTRQRAVHIKVGLPTEVGYVGKEVILSSAI